MDPETLRAVAHWCDEEHRRLCMLPVKTPEGHDALVLEGRKGELAELAGLLRSWAATGKEPAHQKVRDEWRIPFERQARADEGMAIVCVTGKPDGR